MKINKNKTKVMLFNTARLRDFTPKLKIDGDPIDVVEEIKLLGVILTSDLKWNENTMHITKKAYNKLWMIRRLKLEKNCCVAPRVACFKMTMGPPNIMTFWHIMLYDITG